MGVREMASPNLVGIPETMLWTLHNRVSEARRDDGVIRDPDAIRIYEALDYQYTRSFGAAEPSHGVRSAVFDDELRAFLRQHPDGVIVNLGEGLETQRFRVPGADATWISVDLPEAIEIRERFIRPDDQHKHVAASVLDTSWLAAVPKGRPVFITAQGLFMYLPEESVRELFISISESFPGSQLAFDSIPRWISRKTVSEAGWKKTKYYTTPPMPWGINVHEVEPTLRDWVPSIDSIERIHWEFPRGAIRWIAKVVQATPWVGRHLPMVTRVRFGRTIAGK